MVGKVRVEFPHLSQPRAPRAVQLLGRADVERVPEQGECQEGGWFSAEQQTWRRAGQAGVA